MGVVSAVMEDYSKLCLQTQTLGILRITQIYLVVVLALVLVCPAKYTAVCSIAVGYIRL